MTADAGAGTCSECQAPLATDDDFCRRCGAPTPRNRRAHREDRDEHRRSVSGVGLLIMIGIVGVVLLGFVAGLLVSRDDDRGSGTRRVVVCSTRPNHQRPSCTPGSDVGATLQQFLIVGGSGGAVVTTCSDGSLAAEVKATCANELHNDVNATVIVPAQAPTTGPAPTPVPSQPNSPG